MECYSFNLGGRFPKVQTGEDSVGYCFIILHTVYFRPCVWGPLVYGYKMAHALVCSPPLSFIVLSLTMSDFEAFRADFNGDIVTPSDPSYDEAIARWARNAARNAKIVAFVKNPQDVARAIKYAREASLSIAVRGGGHSASGSSSSEGGLVIDLSRYVNSVFVDAEKKLAYIGGGALWKAVDHAAIQHGLASVGGTVNHVCISRSFLNSMIMFSHSRCYRRVLEGRLIIGFPLRF